MLLAVAALCAAHEASSAQHDLGLLVLDEPTDGLDPDLRERLGKALGRHAPAPITLIATNQPELAKGIKEGAGSGRTKVIPFDVWNTSTGITVAGGNRDA